MDRINVQELKRIIQEQKSERELILASEKIISREVDLASLNNALNFPNALAILGIRRCGKSVLSWSLLEGKNYAYINFDDETFYGIEAGDLNTVLKAFYDLYGDVEYMIFDEIQNVSGWELFINRLRRTRKVIITGSNSQMLSGELASSLTGRHIDCVLYPFSYSEYCRYNSIKLGEIKKTEYEARTAALMEKTLGEYIEKGGFPESYKYGPKILKTILQDIVAKDIRGRHKIRLDKIEALAKYLITNHSKEISYSKLKNIFSIKRIETIRSYVKYFEDAYVTIILERFSYKLKEQGIAPKKIYCIDTGLIKAMSFDHSENSGRLLENLVCIELKRRSAMNDTEVYYWKNAQQEEVDFVIKKGKTVTELMQVCYDISDPKTLLRETKSLRKAAIDLRCKNQKIITWGYESKEEDIQYIPAWKWLIDQN